PILYNQILREIATERANSIEQNLRLFALANLAMADAGIACWESKYYYDFWRPITAIRKAQSDSNPATISDPAWEPLGVPGDDVFQNFTPPFPSYPSGHSSFGGALFQVLTRFYGTDGVPFTCTSEETPGVYRHFNTLSQASAENGWSRVYLGVHWN